MPALLGESAAWWAELAGATGTGDDSAEGVAAVSGLLEAIAAGTPHTRAPGPLPPAGAGAFADAAVDEAMWLELVRSGAEHSPALTDADLVAGRAAAHPGRPDALLFAAVLVSQTPGTWREVAVRRHARALLEAAAVLPGADRPHAWRELRAALVNAGDVDAARHP